MVPFPPLHVTHRDAVACLSVDPRDRELNLHGDGEVRLANNGSDRGGD